MLSINAFDIIRYSHHIETGTPLHVNPYKWVSLAPKDDLLMDHKDKLQYNDLDCPLIRYTAPFQYGEELCGGRLNDQEYSKTVHLTKPFMNKMRRWLKKNWHPVRNFYVGPEACELEKKGALLVSALGGRPINRPEQWIDTR